jgi:hypothetical protein
VNPGTGGGDKFAFRSRAADQERRRLVRDAQESKWGSMGGREAGTGVRKVLDGRFCE